MALLDRLTALPRAATATLLGQMASSVTPRWQALSPAGQRVISVASVLLGTGLVWALVYQPIQASRDKDRVRIIGLQSQLQQMRAQAFEVQRLRTMAPVAASASLALADVAQLQAAFGPQASVSLAAGNTDQPVGTTFRVSISQMPYANLVERLEQTRSRFRLRVVSASLTRSVGPAPSSTPATVSGDIVFADAR